MTLTEFLLARIAEDEEAARGAEKYWEHRSEPVFHAVRHHVDRHAPTNVLARCEAKRRIIESTSFSDDPRSAVDEWLETAANWDSPHTLTFPREVSAMIFVLKSLTLPYADHPDYDENWRL